MSARRWPSVRVGCAVLALCVLTSTRARAQVQTDASDKMVLAVGRARALMDGGDGAAARALLDSLVNHSDAGTMDVAEALYWRAALAERTSDAERDWKRMVADVPISPRVPDALLRLGELDILRGRPASAREYFVRLTRDFADTPQRGKAMVMVARSYFEERDNTRACAAVAAFKVDEVPAGESRLQADELRRRCASLAAAAAASATLSSATLSSATMSSAPPPAVPAANAPPTPATSKATPASTVTHSESAASAPHAAEPTLRARYTVQLAAYDTRAQATATVKRLVTRGVKARVDGEKKPFRVRVGHYATRAEANAALTTLKAQGNKGFVAELGK